MAKIDLGIRIYPHGGGMIAVKKKICLIGSFGVGKTSLIERFVYNRYDEKYLTTIGVKISQKILAPIKDPHDGKMIQHTFLIWDIAGLEKFDSVVKNYFRGAAGALAVADLTRPETIEHLSEFCQRFKSESAHAVLIILGNKLDIFNEDKKTHSDLKTVADQYATECLLTSAKTGIHVNDAFSALSYKIGSIK